MNRGPNSVLGIDNFRHLPLDDVDSTNTVCMQKARDGDPGLLWVTARRQLSGRGRRGRAWVSEPGNLYASLLLIDPCDPSDLGSLPMVVALALYGAIVAEMPFAADRVTIKWPNDILVDGKKISGLLVETERLADGRQAVVIGCGINIVHKPEQPLYPTTSLSEAGSSASPESLFAHLMLSFSETLELWAGGANLTAVVAAWRQHVQGIGQPIVVNLPDRSISGIFKDVDDSGLLILLLTSGEIMRVASGDVFFPTK
jgi:BirA family transcriptional regulator, biotin operon repressor / biotin---[acetyl-CoA-carboxylase] ligase